MAAFEENKSRLGQEQIIEARFLLWKATHDVAHLTKAKRLLEYRVEHAPEEYRESMLKNVRLNREIMAAWEASGPKPPARGGGAQRIEDGLTLRREARAIVRQGEKSA